MENETIERLKRIEASQERILSILEAKKKRATWQEDKYLMLCVIKLKYPSAMNFISNRAIFNKIGALLNTKSPAGVSRLLIKHGFLQGKRSENGKQIRGFYLKFPNIMPTSEEIMKISE